MDVSQYRPEFTVVLIDRDPQTAQAQAESLKAMGYTDTRFFPTLESALAMARQELPHIVLVDTDTADAAVEKFLLELRSLSEEIHVVLILPAKQSLQGLQLVSRSLAYDCLNKPFVSSLEVLQTLDRAAGRLYFQFESEQLRDHYGAHPTHASPAPKPIVSTGDDGRGSMARLHGAIQKLAQTKELDDALRIFLESAARALKDVPILYFKYLPGHLSLIFSQAVLLPEEKLRGIGLDLKAVENLQVEAFFAKPAELPLLRELIREVFKKERFTGFAHRVDEEIVGLFVILEDVPFEDGDELSCLRQALDLAYKRNQVLKEKHALDFTDALTGLSNRRHFTNTLEEEISRSRRLLLPVSLIVLSIDRFSAINAKLGASQSDALVKMVAQLLSKTARTNDEIARLGPAEFALILPHTAQMGGAMKAERLRRLAESTKFPTLEKAGLGALTVSCGVSEYPGLSSDSDSLVRSADEALFEVRRDQVNKVCLAAAPEGFQPDFVPNPVPSAPRAKVGGGR